MRCHNCKTKNPPGAVRCSNCFCILDQEKPSSLKALLSKVKQLIGSVVAFMSRRKKLLFVGICVALILIILPLILIILPIVGPSLNNFMSQITRLFTGSSSTSLQLPNGLGVVKAPNGQYVGINDGTYHPFDQERNDSQNLRQQAMQSLQSGASDASSTAISLWSDYLSGDNVNDAEI
jgi:predicted PurR-regulated permease PerM